jgi:hypothetical protein
MMPTNNVKERELMTPGAMVETSQEIHTVPGDPNTLDNYGRLEAGTVGIILERPNNDRPRQYLVSFVGGRTYWMYTNEIKPYINYDKKV